MEKKIYKYQLEVIDSQEIEVPVLAQILCVQTQNENPCLWALVNPDAPKESIKIRIFGTGQPIEDPDRLDYLGTFQMCEGRLVFHAFKETKR